MKKFSSTTRVNSRQTSRNTKIKRIVLLGLFFIVVFYTVPRAANFSAALVWTPVSHFETMFANLGSMLPDFFKDRAALIDEKSDLERRLAYEGVNELTTRRLIEENRVLRRMLGEDEPERIAASVIGRPTVTPYDVLVIDKGTSDGIQKNAPVYLGVDQAIGHVAEVFKNSSVVTLLSTPGFEASVYIYGPNIYTTAHGIGGGVLEVNVPQGILLSVGDLVVVPTFGSGVYGAIEVVNSVPSEPDQRGYVTFGVPIQSMRFVSVGKSAVDLLSFEDAVKVVEQAKIDLTKVTVPSGVLVEATETTASSTATSTDQALETVSEDE